MATTMRRWRRWGVLAVTGALAATIVMSLADRPVMTAPEPEPAALEPVDGTALSRIRLTEQAATRLDLQTEPVESTGGQLAVPSGALMVGPDGTTWVYEQLEPLVFVRAVVVVDHEAGGVAYLSSGLAADTTVVSLGAAELYGVEHGIGH